MMKIALAVLAAAAVLGTAPLVIPSQGPRRQDDPSRYADRAAPFDDRDPGYYRERRGYNSNTTVGVGPGGVTIGPRRPLPHGDHHD